jgi:hypothetical protein
VFQIQCVEQEVDDEVSEGNEENAASRNTWRVIVNNEDGIKCIDKKQ